MIEEGLQGGASSKDGYHVAEKYGKGAADHYCRLRQGGEDVGRAALQGRARYNDR